MSVEEMRKEIVDKVKVLDDEKALQEVLKLLNGEQHTSFIDPMKHLDQIFKENDGLLKRLS
jgi:hypothetical protein